MAGLVYWMKFIFFRVYSFLIRNACAIYNWGNNKSVPPIKNSLLFKSAKKLAEEIRDGKLKSEEVLHAYIDRILEVEPYINAVVQDRFQEALKEAREADALVESGIYSSQYLAEIKPILGVPFTVKNLVKVKGMSSTAGSNVFKDLVASEDATSVTLLRNAGGIVLATTNSAEFGFVLETNNLIHGKTCNPYNVSRTSGGSSGGESALLGAGGSIIGLGNDLGGSIRVPAHFTGLYSHIATPGFIPNAGCFPKPNPEFHDMLHVGPMCRYSEDLITITKILVPENEQKLKFDKEISFEKLKIYYWVSSDDPFVYPVDKDIVAAMNKAMHHFSKNYGTVLEEVKIPALSETFLMFVHNIQASVPNLAKFITLGKVEHMNMFLEFIKFLFGKSLFSFWTIFVFTFNRFPLIFQERHLPYYQEVQKKLENEFDHLLDDNSVLMCPASSVTAPYHYGTLSYGTSVCFTSVFNFLGLPVTSCPLGLHRNGMPQGMQIVGRKNNDALIMACAVELDNVFGGWIPPGKNLSNT